MAEKRSSTPPDDGNTRKLKRMRKGTKSCAECRRRKIKCVFDESRQQTCNDCHERGVECIDQDQAQEQNAQNGDSQNQTLRGRVSQLEDLVRTLVNKLDETTALQQQSKSSQTPSKESQRTSDNSTHPTSHSLPTPTPSLNAETPPSYTSSKYLPGHARNPKSDLGPGPILGLFQNEVVESHGGWDEEVNTATAQDLPDLTLSNPHREEELRTSLMSCFPFASAVKKLSHDFGQWWEIFNSKSSTLEELYNQAMLNGSPLFLSRTLLAFALVLQQVPASYDVASLNLRLPPYELADYYTQQVYKLVLSDDEQGGTFEGLGCLILYAKYSLNAGRPRRAWLTHRRALTFAQLLNLHRKSSRKTPSKGCPPEHKEFLWMEMYVFDHIMGLLFGQPYTVSPKQCDIDIAVHRRPERSYMLRLADIACRINERNQDILTTPTAKMLPITMALDEELEEVKQALPKEWLEYQAQPRDWHDQNSAVMVLFLHAQVRVLLHLPFMLKSTTDQRFLHNKQAALEESRRMIELYEEIMSASGGSFICKIADFQTFTAAMTLLLNMLGYSRDEIPVGTEHPDWRYVDTVKRLLYNTINENGGKVSEQCLRALNMFTCCRGADGDPTEEEMRTQTAKVMVPFYGTVALGCGKGFKMTNAYKSRSGDKDKNALPTPTSSNGSCSLATSPGQALPGFEEPFVGFDSFSNPIPFDFESNEYFPGMNQQVSTENIAGKTFGGFIGAWDSLPSAFNMDLDHDWNWYLPQTGGTGAGPNL